MHITVTDGTNPISGATVIVNGDNSKTTGSAGGCNFTLEDGIHPVSLMKEGYTSRNSNFTVSESDTDFTFILNSE